MNTNNKALCQSSWGRIWLMLRADLIGNKSTLMYLYGTLLAMFVLIPRVPLLFGLSYTEWAEGWSHTYSISTIIILLELVTAFYMFVYVNRRTQHQQPMIFSTLPMALWEKFVAMNLYFVAIWLMAMLTGVVDLLIEWITVPGLRADSVVDIASFMLSSISIVGISSGDYTNSIFGYQVIEFLTIILIQLFIYFLLWFNASKIRNPFLGLVAMWFELSGLGLLTAFLVFIVGTFVISNGTPSEFSTWLLMLCATAYTGILTFIAGKLAYNRLRTIES